MDTQVSLEGTVEEIIFRNDANGFTVLELLTDSDSSTVTAVGVLPFLAPGEHARFTGTWTTHPEYGRQLRVESYENCAPATEEGIITYLTAMIDGVGPATAQAIVRRFGTETLSVMQYAPERLQTIAGIGPARAARITESFREAYAAQQVMLFLQQYNISPAMAMKIYKRYGTSAIARVKEDPYTLISEIDGLGFRTADAIASAMGIAKESPFRLRAGVRYVLSLSAQEGHVCLPQEQLEREAAQWLQVAPELCTQAIEELLLSRHLVSQRSEDTVLLYQSTFYTAEVDVAQRLVQLASAEVKPSSQLETHLRQVQKGLSLELSEEQLRAIRLCTQYSICAVTGGPGTGKTTLIRALINVLEKEHCSVVLCAPTGRAAKRMSEASGNEASTLHRLLEFGYEDGTAAFRRNEKTPLDADVVLVDEASMIDLFLMRALLRALRPGTRLILVGDADQLPSVGPGTVLRDILQCGVFATATLRTIHRQAKESMIVENAHRIRNGETPVLNRGDFFFLSVPDPAEAAKTVVDLCVRRLPARYGFDPMHDIQVLCPMHKGDAGVQALNTALQEALNPKKSLPSVTAQGRLFRQGDKVMQIRNDYQLPWHRGATEGEGVFNGDAGDIVRIDAEEGTVCVRFDDGRVAWYDRESLEMLERAYAISIHKSQGSEFPVVILPLLSGPPSLMTRNLLYTAVTRARSLVVIVGRPDMMLRMIGNTYVAKRYGLLMQRFCQEKERWQTWS